MPTTSYVNSTFSANVIGARTDATGGAVTDLSAEEARFASATLAEGYMTTNAFKVAAQGSPDMTIKVGSGVAKADYYCVAGEVAGQGNYVVRLDVTSQNVTISAADAAQARIDEVYLVVRDNVYDISSRAIPTIAYRQGDVGGSAPGVDTSWKASVKLATITVGANATSITSGTIADNRAAGGGAGYVSASTVTTRGDILVATGNATLVRHAVGANGQVVMADSGQSDGVKWAAPVVATTGYVVTNESTAASGYGDLTTPGPAATVTIGPLGIAIVTMSSYISTLELGQISIAISGANTIAASDNRSLTLEASDVLGTLGSIGYAETFTGLTPGSTTFTMKYSATGTTNFAYRRIGVVTF